MPPFQATSILSQRGRTHLSSAKNTRCIVVLRQKRRFTSINLHLYHYAGNNPVRYTDPAGMSSTIDDYAYQLRTEGQSEKANMLEQQAAKANQGFHINLFKEFSDIFSLDVKCGLGVNASFISEVGVEKECEGFQSSTLLDNGDIHTNLGPLYLNGNDNKLDGDVVFSFGGQIIIGCYLNISGKEIFDFAKKSLCENHRR